jgi:ABC-type lipoprotein release transport system permease subunit
MVRRASFCAVLAGVLLASGAILASDAPLPTILVSRQLAARARLSVGDTMTLAVDPNGRRSTTFRISGIYEPTPDPMRFTAQRLEARMHLSDLTAITADPGNPAAPDTVGAVNVKLVDPADVSTFRTAVSARLPGLVATPTTRSGGGDPFVVLDRFHLAISIVTVSGATAFLLALMIIRAEERRDTIGLLRLVGISQRSLFGVVIVEGLLVAAIGAVFGIIVAVAGEGIVNRIFQARYDTTLVFVRVTRPIALRSIAFAVPLGVLAGVGGSWAVLRRDILSLLRR